MGSNGPLRRVARRTNFEPLEERQMFSAEPLGGSIAHHAEATPDFWYDRTIERTVERDLEALLGDIQQTLASAHALSGVTQARNDYGFLGVGQTVAVIDSGIAWDHPNLGNGYGANARVVGGWDFTWENDANPYDDGPAGSHGTHVAGIVGATENSAGDVGVAPGADLVALRVFDDEGDGYFSWVEKALRWVHTNRNSFANPITAVNLSLGTAFNAATIPGWAMLEEEFAQLEADGIFVSVSAGNSFSTYKTAGLSYPAASPYVVPVMSVDDTGSLSYFSQRHSRAIAAPGRSIRSTVPDYVGNQNGVTDDWANYSGTSMASPYVAGASVLVREAMQFVGMTGITQDAIYNHMMSTADEIFDTATNQYFKRLNVSAAIDALMPADDFGSTEAAAYNLGSLTNQLSISGLVGKFDDEDVFTFTASASGSVKLDVSGTHYLEPNCTIAGAIAQGGDGSWTFDVVAGQTYSFAVSTAEGGGIGYFDVELSLSSTLPPPPEVVKSLVASDGHTYALDADGWLSVDGVRKWENTRDFTVSASGTVYWLGSTGYLARRLSNGAWEALDRDATKFIVSDAGNVYSVGLDGWGNVNGQALWGQSADVTVGGDGSVYWQNLAGQLYRRATNGAWRFLASDVTKFAVRSDGVAYALRANQCVNFDSIAVWNATQDFVLNGDQSVVWHGADGSLYKLPSGGSWQLLGRNVAQFAVAQNGSIYTLDSQMRVTVGGSEEWTGIRAMRTDAWGRLLLERANGTTICVGGQVTVGACRAVTFSEEATSAASIAVDAAMAIEMEGVGEYSPAMESNQRPPTDRIAPKSFASTLVNVNQMALESLNLNIRLASAVGSHDALIAENEVGEAAVDVAISDVDGKLPRLPNAERGLRGLLQPGQYVGP